MPLAAVEAGLLMTIGGEERVLDEFLGACCAFDDAMQVTVLPGAELVWIFGIKRINGCFASPVCLGISTAAEFASSAAPSDDASTFR
jgi:hypothetical protein